MVNDIIALFRPQKEQGPSPQSVAAQAEQQRKLDAQEAKEKREKRSRDQVVLANTGRRGRGTLFAPTGERGVPKAKLGA